MDVTLQSLKAWIGEFFTQNQIVGVRTEGGACLVANYLTWRGKEGTFVTPHTMSWQTEDNRAFHCETLRPEISRLVRLFDDSGEQGTGVQARTALKLIRQVEDNREVNAWARQVLDEWMEKIHNEQVAQPVSETEASPELVGTTS